jgi:hypothetical protein
MADDPRDAVLMEMQATQKIINEHGVKEASAMGTELPQTIFGMFRRLLQDPNADNGPEVLSALSDTLFAAIFYDCDYYDEDFMDSSLTKREFVCAYLSKACTWSSLTVMIWRGSGMCAFATTMIHAP